jgi:esterase/lipase
MKLDNLKNDLCFIILPGFAPDDFPAQAIKKSLHKQGYKAIAANFWGTFKVDNFSDLTIEQCQAGVAKLIKDTAKEYKHVIGVGISVGGALLLEYAKNNNHLDCLVSIGTPFKLKNRRLIKLGFILYPGINLFWQRAQKIKAWRLLPIACAKMVVDYLEGDFLKNLEKIKTPTLLMQSKHDFITDWCVVDNFLNKLSSKNKQVVYFESNNHVIEYDGTIILKTLESFKKNN